MSYNLGVSLADYQDGPVAQDAVFDTAATTPEELYELSKALEAGAITGRETTGSLTASGAPLKVESLENTLKSLEFREQDIVFWKETNKAPAYNTVEEFNQLVSVGSDRGGFTMEGELPEEEDSVYRRLAEQIKFLGVTKAVSHVMQLVRTQPDVGNMITREAKNGTMWILRKANRSLAWGNANIIPQEFNGIYAQHRNAYSTFAAYNASPVVIDLRGRRLTESDLEDGARVIMDNHGFADTLFAPLRVTSNFSKNFLSMKQIFPQADHVANGLFGQRVNTVQTQFATIDLKSDKFLGSGPSILQGQAAETLKAPAAPGGVAIAVASDTSSLFATADAGDYYYGVRAVNRYGMSALTMINTSVQAVTAGQCVNLTFTSGAGTFAETGYVIYRSKKTPATAVGATPLYPIFSISTAELTAGYDGGSAGVCRDRNRFLPDCDQAFIMEKSTDVWEVKQLAPLMRMDLAVLSPSTRFMLLLYATPQLYAPGKVVTFRNIGTAAS